MLMVGKNRKAEALADVWPSVSFDMEWVTSNWRQGG